MAQIKSKNDLKRFLITSQLVRPNDWNRIEAQTQNGVDVSTMLDLFEQQRLLTSLQTSRIRKGETEGLVLGDYKLMYRNASGSFARVYRAEKLDGSETVAIKLLRDRWAADPDAVAGFHREARICQRFKHPNIVPIYDIGSDGRFHFFTMEFVEGGNLRDFLKIRKSVTPAEAAKCVYEICDGLDYALSMGATHRDLKLTNVLMSSSGVVKLVDFGLAGADSPSHAGTSDDVHRALEYASLERGTNAPNNDPRSDIFFAGAIFYELLSGQSPWARTRDREERKQLSRYTSIQPLIAIRPDLPAGLVDIVNRMMEVNPHHRFQSAAEVKKALRTALQELGHEIGDPDADEPTTDLDIDKPFNLLVADSVKKRCKALQQYFNRHNFSLSFVTRPASAIERLKGPNPPDGVLFLADTDRELVLEQFPQAQAYGRSLKIPCLAVFAADDEEVVRRTVNSTRFGATMFQPATLRDIRMHFQEVGEQAR
jgi:serine/threonine protein kinase